jgi:nicotinamidase-related amidase
MYLGFLTVIIKRFDIIDMQNYFLSATLDRSKGKTYDAMKHLVKEAIPAARKASIRVI